MSLIYEDEESLLGNLRKLLAKNLALLHAELMKVIL